MRSIQSLGLLILTCGLAFWSPASAADDETPEIHAVRTFEMEISAIEDPAQRIALTRAFFADLKTATMKIEAIGTMDDRYQPQVPFSLWYELLASLLNDSDATVQVRALEAVSRMHVAHEFPDHLIRLWNTGASPVKIAALEAMGRSSSQVTYCRPPLPGVRAIADRFLAPIKAGLASADDGIRTAALEAMCSWLKEQAVDLEPFVTDSAPKMRIALAWGMSRLYSGSARLVLEPLLGDADEDVRRLSASYLGIDGFGFVANNFTAGLKSADASMRAKAADALGHQAAEMIVLCTTLVNLLDDTDADVRAHAVEALARFKDPRHYGRLQLMLVDPNDRVREAARKAIAGLGQSVPK